MAAVVLQNVCKEFKGARGEVVRAVRSANLNVAHGEFVVLVGPSGCGKSTTLRMIAGLEDISDGTISIEGNVVNDIPPKDRDIAMVFQNYALYPHMTVFENMAFGLKLRKVPKDQIQSRVKETAGTLGLSPCLDRKPASLSGGQQQRVALGRAIVQEPKVFLFDEPLSNLDAKMRVQMRTEIARLHSKLGATMIYVTHDQVEAMTMGDRIVVMDHGFVQQVDTPIELYNKPKNIFVAGFIGSPPMNFFKGTITAHHDDLYFKEHESPGIHPPGHVSLKLPESFKSRLEVYVSRTVSMGLRPEHFSGPVAAPIGDDMEITATVEVVEPMGAETYVYLTTGVDSFVARVPSDAEVRVGQKLALTAELDKAHFFDPDTELALV